jgi:hypothetical protein
LGLEMKKTRYIQVLSSNQMMLGHWLGHSTT